VEDTVTGATLRVVEVEEVVAAGGEEDGVETGVDEETGEEAGVLDEGEVLASVDEEGVGVGVDVVEVLDSEVELGVGVGVEVDSELDEGVGLGVDVDSELDEGVGVGVDVDSEVDEGVGVGVDVDVDVEVDVVGVAELVGVFASLSTWLEVGVAELVEDEGVVDDSRVELVSEVVGVGVGVVVLSVVSLVVVGTTSGSVLVLCSLVHSNL